jgi:hypothetical protein
VKAAAFRTRGLPEANLAGLAIRGGVSPASLGVEGDFEKEMPGPEQLSAVHDLLTWLLLWSGLSIKNVSMHMDHAQTDCPGANFKAALPDLLSRVRGRLAPAADY